MAEEEVDEEMGGDAGGVGEAEVEEGFRTDWAGSTYTRTYKTCSTSSELLNKLILRDIRATRDQPSSMPMDGGIPIYFVALLKS